MGVGIVDRAEKVYGSLHSFFFVHMGAEKDCEFVLREVKIRKPKNEVG